MNIEELLSLIKYRRSIRNYTKGNVSREQLTQIIEAARWAPSGNNRQQWEFIVVTDEATRESLANVFINWRNSFLKENPERHITKKDYLLDVPSFIVVCADPRRDPRMRSPQTASHHTIYEYILLSGMGAVIENMLLAITTMGLGSVWLTTDIKQIEKSIKELLDIPDKIRVITVLPVGKPKNIPRPRPKREIEEILHWEKMDKSRLISDDEAVQAGLNMEKIVKTAIKEEEFD